MKILNVSILCQAYYNNTIEVPDDLSYEEALEYARDHLSEIPLGPLEYIENTDELDEDNCNFAI